MEKIKSPQAALLNRAYGYRGRDRLAVTVMAGFRVSDPGQLVGEAEMWEAAAEGLQPGQALDLGMPKTRGEVLVAGRAYALKGEPVQGMEVGLTLETVHKRLYVFGDRYWAGVNKPAPPLTAPQPFSEMDLTWKRAFGGLGYDDNPDGSGLIFIQTPEGRFWPAPNVEYPDRLLSSPDDRPEPAGLGPRGLNQPGRLKNLGTFDDTWLSRDWPGLPEDFRFSFFNVAPTDQQLPGYFKGEELFTLHGLQPDKPQVASKLPGLRARAFVKSRQSGSPVESFTETSLNLDTLWLFPHLDLGVVIWHGSQPITDDEAEDVSLLTAFLESNREAPLPVEHYQALCHSLTAPSTGSGGAASAAATAAAKATPLAEVGTPADVPLAEVDHPTAELQAETEPSEAVPGTSVSDPRQELPPELAQYFPQTPPPPEYAQPQALLEYYTAQAEALELQLDDMLRSMGINPDHVPPGDLPPELARMLPDLPEAPEGLSLEELAAFHENQAALLEQSLDDHLRTLGPSQTLEAVEELPYTVDDSIAALKKIPGMEDAVKTLHELKQEYESVSTDLEAQKAVLAAMEEEGVRAAAAIGAESAAEAASRSEIPDVAPQTATASGPRPPSTYTREDVLAAKEVGLPGADLSGLDLSGADLSGMNLSGADLTDSNLDGAVLVQANLTGSNLNQTILTGAVLSGAVLSGADLRKSNLARAKADRADFSGAQLIEADLSYADLSGANLEEAVLSRAGLNKASLVGVRAKGAKAEWADFDRADLSRADFSESKLSHAGLNGARMDQAVFRQADLSRCWVSGAQGQGVDFTGADLHEIRSSGQTSLPLADVQGANLTKAYFEQSDMSRCNFSEANLDQASFIRCDLKDANLNRSRARQADFSHSDLSGADMMSVNLMQGSLRKAQLRETDLSRANLFAVDFYKSTMGGTKLEGANLKRTILTFWSST
jgi:uncharacterized protein YjbI with pentapeptide repeats